MGFRVNGAITRSFNRIHYWTPNPIHLPHRNYCYFRPRTNLVTLHHLFLIVPSYQFSAPRVHPWSNFIWHFQDINRNCTNLIAISAVLIKSWIATPYSFSVWASSPVVFYFWFQIHIFLSNGLLYCRTPCKFEQYQARKITRKQM